jgi:hypothetical protein
MLFQRITRWHWIAISVVVGVTLGGLNRLNREDWSSTYGESLSKMQFAEAIARGSTGIGHLSHLVIYSEEIQLGPGNRQQVHIVSGQYDESPSPNASRPAASATRVCFVAEIPFIPPIGAVSVPSSSTVLDYLDRMQIPYIYAWWRDPKTAMSIWTTGSILLIGVVWPSLLNLLAYGSIFVPAAKVGVVADHPSGSSSGKSATPLSEQERAELEQLQSEMTKNLENNPPDAAPLAAMRSEAAPCELSVNPLDSPTSVPDGPAIEFGIKQEDFYPTSRKPQPKR